MENVEGKKAEEEPSQCMIKMRGKVRDYICPPILITCKYRLYKKPKIKRRFISSMRNDQNLATRFFKCGAWVFFAGNSSTFSRVSLVHNRASEPLKSGLEQISGKFQV